ncbi:zf-HC2 domain-containing protein [Spongiactinospora rosea]|uniref:Zf-HC2 domain-containing protein n=1 Tax=Spongiactinospora rosea TaxID=2248750 RepID=A0A366M0D7_9ACTN|nr:zf-HC2 domain-containing protein [Spongiactinospora rosea]RBQ19243.1 zf-HC2 domain-containing protein [Spongiactinospora rosea]
MTGADWHVPPDLMERYVAGRLDPKQVMSVEAHVGGCARCRAAVPYDEAWLTGGWDRLLDEVDRPRPRPAERLLCRFGVPGHLARLLTATPALARGWLTAVAIVLALAVAAGRFEPAGPAVLLAFLVAAPVLPVAGIALAYGRHVDPVHELQAATPMAGPRLLFIRAGAVLVTAVAMTGAATPLLPGTPGQATAWLLPALALSAATLLLSARLALPLAAGLPCGLWLGAVVPMVLAGGDRFLPFTPVAQALYGVAAVLFAFVYARRGRLSSEEISWARQ